MTSRERPSTRNSFTEPKWFQVLRLRYQTEGLFFYADHPPWERRPWPGLYIKWGCGYRVPLPNSTAADGETVRSGAAHAESAPGGKSPAIWGELPSAAKAVGGAHSDGAGE